MEISTRRGDFTCLKIGKEVVDLGYSKLLGQVEEYLFFRGGKPTPYSRVFLEKGNQKDLLKIMEMIIKNYEGIIERQGKNWKS